MVRRPDGTNAFSLVEVVIALAVMSFAIVGVIGFIPVGLHNLKNAIDMSTQTRIMQSICASLNETDFTNIPTVSTNYYDDEGNTLASSSSPGLIYTAVVNVASPTTVPGGLTSTNLLTVTAAISSVSQPNLIATNSQLIANMRP